MTNQEVLDLLEETKEQYRRYEEYKSLQTNEVIGLGSQNFRRATVISDCQITEYQENASMELSISPIQFYNRPTGEA